MEKTKYGIKWEMWPTKDESEQNWSILRAPDKGSYRLCILSHCVVSTRTHYYGGRTRPCQADGCTICEAGTTPRFHAYFAALKENDRRRVIVEITKDPALSLKEHFDQVRTLRGCIIELGRISRKGNGRVYLKVLGTSPHKDSFQEGPDVAKIMARVWELKETPLFEQHNGQLTPMKIADVAATPVEKTA